MAAEIKPPVRGFTLLEVLVALAIVGLVVVALAAAFKHQIDAQLHLEKKSAAAQIAWNLLEAYRLAPPPATSNTVTGRHSMGRWGLDWTRRVTVAGREQVVEIQVGANPPLHVATWRGLLP